MKTQSFLLSIVFSCITLFSFAQNTQKQTQEKIKVNGNCESCKKHIEKAAVAAGASSAVWNTDTKVLVVKYDASKTSNKKIQEKIASVGYDTQDVKASDAAYNKLDECCQYDRDKTPAKN
jgi:copper chaperone CopZ